MLKDMDFLSFSINLSIKYGKQIMDTGANTWKTASKRVIHESAEAAAEFLGNKIADKIVKVKPVINENSRNAEQIIVHQKRIKTIIINMELCKI